MKQRSLRLIAIVGMGAAVGCEGAPTWEEGAVSGEQQEIWSNSVAVLGGTAVGDPTISSWRAGRLDLFYRGSTNSLRHKWYNDGDAGWSAEQDLGGSLSSSPAAVSWGDQRIDVFARSSSGHLAHQYWNGSAWISEDLGGSITGSPAVASMGYGSLDVFARDSSNRLIVKSFRSGSWTGWTTVSGTLASDPAAVSWGPNRLDVFARNSSSQLLHTWKTTGSWAAWENLGGSIASAPGVSSWGLKHLDVFARNSSNSLVHRAYSAGWSAWETLSGAGTFTSAPDAVSWGADRIDIVMRNSSNAITHFTWTEALRVPLYGQETGMWCSAASAQMVSKYFGIDIVQCEEVNHFLSRSDCCTTHNCDANGIWPDFPFWGMSSSNTSDGTALTLDQVKDQLVTKGKPFTFSWFWGTGPAGHMMAAVDYERFASDDWVSVNDPEPVGVGTHTLMTYTNFVSGSDHTHWRDYYDVAVAKNTGDVLVSRSEGNGLTAASRWHDWFCIPGEQCELGDVNGDGKKDIISFDHNGKVYIALSTGSAFSGTGVTWHTTFCYGTEQCKVGDFNGDGKDDILVFNGTGFVIVSLSTGTAFGAASTWKTAFCYTGEDCDVGDYNGDNKTDVIVRQNGGNAIVALSTGTAFGGNTMWSTTFNYCFGGQVCKTGDVNGDGKADLIGFTFGSTNDVYVALSNGSAFGAAAKWNDYFGVPGEVVAVGDLDGDNMADIVTFNRGAGYVYSALSTGTSFNGVGWLWGQGIGQTADECRVGDVDGDGRADAVTFQR